ncbi:MAG: TraB/GumN family protein [Paludibacteraceae bacterium]
MKRINLFLLLIVVCSFAGKAQLLWKISGHGLKQDSYLFGTHHLIPIDFLDSIPGVYPAFNKANMVVSEIVLNDMDVSAKIQQAAMLPDTITMEDLLTSDEFNFVDKELMNVMNMSLMNVNKMHPSIIQTLYELELYKERAHFDENTKSDSYFQLVANRKNIPVKGLETAEKQIELLFPKNNLKDKAQQLVITIKNKDTLYNEYQEINKLYRNGDIEGINSLNKKMNRECGITDEENAEMIDNRNIDWVKQLPELMKSNSCFIAVGALHLPGENGLIKLLKKEGYKVTSVIQ